MPQSRTTKVLALSLGTFLTQLVGLVSGIIMVRLLTKEDLATYRQTMLAYHFVAPFLTLALPSALYFFLPARPGDERTVLLSNLAPLGLMGLVFSAFLLLGGGKLLALRFNNPALENTLRLLALYPVFALPAGALEACLVSRERIKQLTIYNVVSRLLLTLVLIGVCIWTRRPEPLVLTQVAVAGMLLLPALRLMLRACPSAHSPAIPQARLMWDMAKYSVPLGMAAMLGTMSLNLSSVIVAALCSPRDFAVYSVGAFELPLITIVTGSINTVILADMSTLCHNNNLTEALRLFRTAAIRSASILIPAMVFFLFFAEPFLVTLFSDQYIDSVLPFRIYLLLLPARIVYFGAALMALGMTRPILIRSGVALVTNGVLTGILVTYLGYIGGPIALVLTMYAWSVTFNLRLLAKGFNEKAHAILPLGHLAQITLRAAFLGCGSWLLVSFTIHTPLAQLIAGGILFWPCITYWLWRMKLLYIPTTFIKVPTAFAGVRR